jgi:hypothetical protein
MHGCSHNILTILEKKNYILIFPLSFYQTRINIKKKKKKKKPQKYKLYIYIRESKGGQIFLCVIIRLSLYRKWDKDI